MLRGLYLLSEGARHSSTGPEAPRNGFSRPVLAAMLRKGRVRAGKAGDDGGRHQGHGPGTRRGTFTFRECSGGDVDRIE